MDVRPEHVTGNPCACGDRATRRDVLTVASIIGLNMAAAAAGTHAIAAEAVDERPQEGDHLVAIDGDAPVPLGPADISETQVLAWPMDPMGKIVRNGSRLNKVLLLRLDPATLVGATQERAADGVVAYSAICPHAGCEVSGWLPDQKILECPCHYSHYNPREAAAIIDGPTTRALAALPLKIQDGKLVVAKPFIGRVGIVPT
jgi:rieske iron-sulfur protein